MSIYAVGVDIAEIDRMTDVIDRYGDRFLSKVFTETEIAYCRTKGAPAQSFAARFATKEAMFKALGTGLNTGLRWKDVEVVNNELGRPGVRLYGKTAEMVAGRRIHLSISHTGNMSIAMIVIDEKERYLG